MICSSPAIRMHGDCFRNEHTLHEFGINASLSAVLTEVAGHGAVEVFWSIVARQPVTAAHRNS